MLARPHGLGAVWTTGNMAVEREIAALLGIPYQSVMPAAVVPVAYPIGTKFRPAHRAPVEEVLQYQGVHFGRVIESPAVGDPRTAVVPDDDGRLVAEVVDQRTDVTGGGPLVVA